MRVGRALRFWSFVPFATFLGCSLGDNVGDDTASKTSQAITDDPQDPDPTDPRQFSIVRIGDGTQTRICTGTLISPRLVLTATHCFGTGTPNDSTRAIANGGNPKCTVEETSTGQITAFGGCGHVEFYAYNQTLNHPEAIANIVHVWTNVSEAAETPVESDNSKDIAIAVLDRRATPATSAHATFMRPWLVPEDGPDDGGFWASQTPRYFGWGITQDIDSCDDITGTTPGAAPFRLPLTLATYGRNFDTDGPETDQQILGNPLSPTYYGGLMFDMNYHVHEVGIPLPGDSGGPLFIDTANGPRVIGVHHGYSCVHPPANQTNITAYWAKTMDFATGNQDFIRKYTYLGQGHFWGDDTTTPNSDSDGDGVADVGPERTFESESDNCPNDYNPDQLDTDGDGIGDACDHCANIADDGTNTNIEAEELYYGATPAVVTPANPTASYTNSIQFPADVCDSRALAAPAGGLNAQPSIEDDGPEHSQPVFPNPSRTTTCAGPQGSYTCNTLSTAMLAYAPFAPITANANNLPNAKLPWANATEGWRRCSCDTPDNPALCEERCPRRASAFFSSSWLTLHVASTNIAGERTSPIGDPESFVFGGPFFIASQVPPVSYQARWFWWDDPNVSPLPPLPQQFKGNGNIGNTKGRLWWYVPHVNGQQLDQIYHDSAILSSVFTPVEVDEWIPTFFPRYPGTPVGAFSLGCVACGGGSRIFTVLKNVDPSVETKVFAVTESGPVPIDVSSDFNAASLADITPIDARLVPAEEPSYQLDARFASFVVLDASNSVSAVLAKNPQTGQLEELGGFNSLPGGGDGDHPRSLAVAAAVPSGSGFEVALSGKRGQLVGVGATTSETSNVIWTAGADPNGVWSANTIAHGPALGHVDGITMLSSNGLFYALDEGDQAEDCRRADEDERDSDNEWRGWRKRHSHHDHDKAHTTHCDGRRVRLLEIDPEQSVVREVTSWQRRRNAHFGIAAAYGDALLISSSGEGQHSFALLGLSGGTIASARVVSGRGEIAVFPRASMSGFAWGEMRDGTLVTHSVDFPKMPNSPRDVASCF